MLVEVKYRKCNYHNCNNYIVFKKNITKCEYCYYKFKKDIEQKQIKKILENFTTD